MRKTREPGEVCRLDEAVHTVKIAAADRGDVVVDMKEADRARLELLGQDLQSVFDKIPADDPQWDFALSTGLQPRFWIDATSYVMMGRDRRTYRFVRDTRLGRVILAESTAIKPVSDAITAYIAERLVERERLLDGEIVDLRRSSDTIRTGHSKSQSTTNPPSVSVTRAEETPSWSYVMGIVAGFLWFLFGALAGCGGILLFLLRDRLVDFI